MLLFPSHPPAPTTAHLSPDPLPRCLSQAVVWWGNEQQQQQFAAAAAAAAQRRDVRNVTHPFSFGILLFLNLCLFYRPPLDHCPFRWDTHQACPLLASQPAQHERPTRQQGLRQLQDEAHQGSRSQHSSLPSPSHLIPSPLYLYLHLIERQTQTQKERLMCVLTTM